jgi:hypothetical protein
MSKKPAKAEVGQIIHDPARLIDGSAASRFKETGFQSGWLFSVGA